ncbi:Hypothetical predicted protein [Xyrichtys novacula]|uniref:Uncharacterized protein n=1 Tax=Xyrichtys novacula TaxID=13765 RepID=A0AAV1HPY0_XYRNO|nr:Hypothetical predicted protein [Xyrichtys novacula]
MARPKMSSGGIRRTHQTVNRLPSESYRVINFSASVKQIRAEKSRKTRRVQQTPESDRRGRRVQSRRLCKVLQQKREREKKTEKKRSWSDKHGRFCLPCLEAGKFGPSKAKSRKFLWSEDVEKESIDESENEPSIISPVHLSFSWRSDRAEMLSEGRTRFLLLHKASDLFLQEQREEKKKKKKKKKEQQQQPNT